MKRAVFAIFLASVLVFAFQNCGKGFDVVTLSSPSSSLDETNPDNPTKSYELPGSQPPVYVASKLDWTLNENSAGFKTAVAELANQCVTRRMEFLTVKKVAPILLDEGLLPGDPKIEEMKNVKAGLDKILYVAFCSYFANTSAERALALKTVVDYIDEWENIYVGDGNPINDRRFRQLFMAADLIAPKMTQSEYVLIKALADRMDPKEAAFMAALNSTDLKLQNNWMLHHLTIRFYANMISGNATQWAQIQQRLNAEIQKQYTAPADFVLSTCANIRAIGVYGSFDLQQRDAFTYHIAGLDAVMPILKLKPDAYVAATRTKLVTAMEVMKPYVLNEKTHPEFTCTTVQYDRDKIALDPTVASSWNPDSARELFRYARMSMPEITSWSTRYLGANGNAWIKVLATGKGDVL